MSTGASEHPDDRKTDLESFGGGSGGAPRRRRRWLRALVLVTAALSALVLAGVLTLRSPWFEDRVRQGVVDGLETALRTEVSVGEAHVQLWPVGLELRDIAVKGATGVRILEAERVALALELEPLRRRALRLSSVEVDQPRVEIRWREDGALDLPMPRGAGGGSGFEVELGSLAVRGGEIVVQETRLPVDVLASSVGFELAGIEGGARGEIVLRGARIERPSGEAQVDLSAQIEVAAGRVALERVVVVDPGGDLDATLTGGWSSEEQRFVLTGGGRVAAELLQRSGWLPLDARGRLQANVELLVPRGGEPTYSGQVSSRSVSLFGSTLRGVEGELQGSRTGTQARFRGDWHGGALDGRLEIGLGESRRLSVSVAARDVPLVRLLEEEWLARTAPETPEWATSLRLGALGGRVRATLDYGSALDEPTRGFGSGALVVEAVEGEVPVGGRVPFLVQGGVLRSEAAALRTPGSELRGDLRLALDGGGTLGTFELAASDLAAFAREIEALRPGTTGGFQPSGGRSTVEGRFERDAEALRIRLRATASDVDTGRFAADRVEVAGRSDGSTWRDLSLRAWRRGGSAQLQRDVWVPDPETEVSLLGLLTSTEGEVEGWPLGEIAPDLGLRGRLAGSLRGAAFEGRIREAGLQRGDDLWSVGPIDVQGRVSPDGLDLERLRFGDAGRVQGNLTWREGGTLRGSLRVEELEVTRRHRRGTDLLRLSGSASASGNWPEPEVRLELRASSTAMEEPARVGLTWRRGALDGTLSLPDVAACRVLGPWSATARDVQALCREVRVEGLVELLQPEALGLRDLRGGGPVELRVTGVGEATDVVLTSPSFDLALGDTQLRLLEPARLSWREGAVVVDSLFFESDGGDSTLFVVGGMEGTGQVLDVRLQAALPATALESLELGADLEGRVEILAAVEGTLERPELNGVAALREGRVTTEELPYPVENVDLVALLYPDRAVVDRVTAEVAGGRVRGEGEVSLPELETSLRASLEGLRLRTDGNWAVRGGGDLNVGARPGSPVEVRGAVRLTEVSYEQDFDRGLGQLLRTLFEPAPERIAAAAVPDTGLRLDLDVRGERALRIRNNIADLEGDLDLRVRGQPQAPRVYGEILLRSGGRLDYGGDQYVLERGRLIFDRPTSNEPRLDVSATTRRLDYVVTLSLTGTRDRLQAHLTSDPPLPELDVWSLLASGGLASGSDPGLGTTGLDQSSVGAEALLYGQASSLVQDRVSSLFGLDRFRLNPITSGDSLASARVTIGKRLSRDVFVTYSVNPATTEDSLLEVEWRLSDLVVLVLTQNADGSYSASARLEQVF